MGQREYGRHRVAAGLSGGTHRAVQKAIAAGRIQVVDGKIDSELADKAWAENSSESHRRGTGLAEPSVGPGEQLPPTPGTATTAGGVSFAQASTFEKGWRGKLAKLEYEERSGKLVEFEDVRQRWAAIVVVARNKLLGLPSRAKEKIPSLTPADLRILDALLREVLEDLASAQG